MDLQISSALISVFNKENLEPLVRELHNQGVELYSTGGTLSYISDLQIPVRSVEDLTGYPSILGGRVKTLHPKVFGAILNRQNVESDLSELSEFEIPNFDLVVVDLYPFEETVAAGGSHEEIIEKIDIGGISLIRAAAKNFKHTWIVSNRDQYDEALRLLKAGPVKHEIRSWFASEAFAVSSKYDSAIFSYLSQDQEASHLRISASPGQVLRYGENPHQKGTFFGSLSKYFNQLSGKELSYNNLLDVEASVRLLADFDQELATCGILKHNNACGVGQSSTLTEAYSLALAADPLSAFGGIIVTNKTVDKQAAEAMHTLFFEILIAPSYTEEARELLTSKKNRILLQQIKAWDEHREVRSLLGGWLVQDADRKIDEKGDLKVVTDREPSIDEERAMLFAARICKHSKSNTIVIATDKQLIASGVGETSRVDALKHALEKARHFELDVTRAAMASDAFFPFPDCVEIAHSAGIRAVIQPGGSVKDQLSIDYCDDHDMTMVFTGHRHFKH